jgi:uncharacterized protein (DUF488 family)
VRVVTIGAYGFDEEAFFETLREANIDVFVDTRRRRGVRGAQYAFANARRLQDRLAALGIRYVHRLDLAPSFATVQAQGEADREGHVRHRDRTTITPELRETYTRECLDPLEPKELIDELGNPGSVLFFCVERVPEACHRSLLADAVAKATGAEVVHLVPDVTL